MPNTVYVRFMHGYNPLENFYNTKGNEREGGVEDTLRQELEKAGYTLKFTNDASNLTDVAAIISWETDPPILANLRKYPRERCILLAFEPPCSRLDYYDQRLEQYFGTIFTLFESQAYNPNYVKFNWPLQPFRIKKVENCPDFSEKKFCVMVNSNNYNAFPGSTFGDRRKTIAYFASTGDFDLYGRGWDGLPCWKGTVQDKQNTIKNYKFIICYENSHDGMGYMTEKMFDAFAGRCVPIYLGAPNVTSYVPEECFVHRRNFASEEELYRYMKSMDRTTHESYLKAAEQFLDGPKFDIFKTEYFIRQIMSRIKR